MSENVKPTITKTGELDILAHYGIKGMRWGVRRKNPSGDSPLKDRKGREIVDDGEGGYKNTKGHTVSEDAVLARARQAKVKREGTDALSTKELLELANRIELEQRYDRITNTSSNGFGKRFVEESIKEYGPDFVISGVKAGLGDSRVTQLLSDSDIKLNQAKVEMGLKVLEGAMRMAVKASNEGKKKK